MKSSLLSASTRWVSLAVEKCGLENSLLAGGSINITTYSSIDAIRSVYLFVYHHSNNKSLKMNPRFLGNYAGQIHFTLCPFLPIGFNFYRSSLITLGMTERDQWTKKSLYHTTLDRNFYHALWHECQCTPDDTIMT